MDYDVRSATSAARMLAPKSKGGKGQDAAIILPNVGTFDPALQEFVGGGAPDEHIGSGVELQYDIREIDGKSIKQGDKRFMLSPKKQDGSDLPTFDTKATLRLADGTYAILAVRPLKPAGVPIYFELQLRGAK